VLHYFLTWLFYALLFASLVATTEGINREE